MCYTSFFLSYINRHDFYQLPNLCSMEINEIRPFFIHSMGVMTQLVRDPATNAHAGPFD